MRTQANVTEDVLFLFTWTRDMGTKEEFCTKKWWKHIPLSLKHPTPPKTPTLHKDTINQGTGSKASEAFSSSDQSLAFPLCSLCLHLRSLCVSTGPSPLCSCSCRFLKCRRYHNNLSQDVEMPALLVNTSSQISTAVSEQTLIWSRWTASLQI